MGGGGVHAIIYVEGRRQVILPGCELLSSCHALALEAVCAAMAKLRIAQYSTKHAHHAAVARSIRAVRAPQQPCALRVPVHASGLPPGLILHPAGVCRSNSSYYM